MSTFCDLKPSPKNSTCSDDVFENPTPVINFSSISECLFPSRFQRDSTSSASSSTSSSCKIPGCNSSTFGSNDCASCLAFPFSIPTSLQRVNFPPCCCLVDNPSFRRNCHVRLKNYPSCSSLSNLLSSQSGNSNLPARVRPVDNDYNYVPSGALSAALALTSGTCRFLMPLFSDESSFLA